jgi:pimeloyl-ACP methyl ester carboxylesterase
MLNPSVANQLSLARCWTIAAGNFSGYITCSMFARAGVIISVAILVSLVPAAARLGALEPPAGQSHSATVDGAQVHYTDYGTGDSALVFIHGWACDETVWREQAAPLSDKIRVITIDLPGHGQSDKPDVTYTMDLYARAIDAVVADAKLQSAILVGHSNGTPAVRQFYRKNPAKVRGLVIVDGPLRPFIDATKMQKFIAPLRDNYEQSASRIIDGITRPIANESLRGEIKTLMLRTPKQVAVSEFEHSADPELWKPDKINVPVLMVLAKQPSWSDDYEQFVRGLVPDLDYQVCENVSHFLMMEKPREFNDAVLAFLAKHELLPNHS